MYGWRGIESLLTLVSGIALKRGKQSWTSRQPLEIQQYGAQRHQRPQWTDDCASNPLSPCCYMCDSPPATIPAQCRDTFGRDDCQTFDRLSRLDDVFTFNASSQRHDTSQATLESLYRQVLGSLGRIGFPDVPRPTTIADEQALETNLLANPNAVIKSDWETLSSVVKQRWNITIPAAKLPTSGIRNPESSASCFSHRGHFTPSLAASLSRV
jgi:hypothetical protein